MYGVHRTLGNEPVRVLDRAPGISSQLCVDDSFPGEILDRGPKCYRERSLRRRRRYPAGRGESEIRTDSRAPERIRDGRVIGARGDGVARDDTASL